MLAEARTGTVNQVREAIRSVRNSSVCAANGHPSEVFELTARLRSRIALRRETYLQAMAWETGFIRRDCVEMLEAALQFLDYFPEYLADHRALDRAVPYTYPADGRTLRLQRHPYGVVAAITPQNAFLLLTLTVGLCALAVGNGVVIKAPSQSAWSAALLQEDIEEAAPSFTRFRLILASAPDFLRALYAERVRLLHYIGSSHHASDLLAEGYRQGIQVLIDGDGNGYLYVDRSYSPAQAASLIVAAATRYNGQTCTSVNGVLVEETIFEEVCAQTRGRMEALRWGDPFLAETDVGPLFSERRAEVILDTIHASGGEVHAGGARQGRLLQPTLVVAPNPDSALVREGVFGPAVWIVPTRGGSWREWFAANRYPLACGILSHDSARVETFLHTVAYARISINADPSVESVFEPWGAYPSSGLNPPSSWPEKYQRVVQIDEG